MQLIFYALLKTAWSQFVSTVCSTDMWGLGILLYALVCGRCPFLETSDSETLCKIMDCEFTLPAALSGDCRDLVERLLVRRPEQRPTLEQLLQHAWLRDVVAKYDYSELMPLVSRRPLEEDEHEMIVRRMESGRVALQDETMASVSLQFHS